MQLLEHEAKQILRARGFEIPRGALVRQAADLEHVLPSIPLPIMVKAQVPVGGRGKAGAVLRVEDAPAGRDQIERLLRATACPVNIFVARNGLADVIVENEDRCTLCDLCRAQCPTDAIAIQKLYSDEIRTTASLQGSGQGRTDGNRGRGKS